VPDPLLTTDQIITIVLALVTGIGGSLLVLFLSTWRENRKENETANRARALIVAELETVRNHLQHWLDANKSDLGYVPLISSSTEVEYLENVIDNLQYLALDVDIKLKAFNANELRELHSVYTQIKTMNNFRTIGVSEKGTIIFGGTQVGNVQTFVYRNDDLKRWVKALNSAIEKLS